MKPLPPIKAHTGQPASPLLADTAGTEHVPQLFQLLTLPNAELTTTASSAETTTNLALSQGQTRDELPRRYAGELTATAYVLAGYVQQLTAAYAQPVTKEGEAQQAPAAHAVNVRLEATTASGGLASVELLHPIFGQVGLEIELVNGALRVTATAESDYAANAIAQGQAVLIERLREHGVTLEALDVNVVRHPVRENRGPRTRTRQRKQES